MHYVFVGLAEFVHYNSHQGCVFALELCMCVYKHATDIKTIIIPTR